MTEVASWSVAPREADLRGHDVASVPWNIAALYYTCQQVSFSVMIPRNGPQFSVSHFK
jgi:hypothetical protein